ncbi:MAG TPA: DsbA family oxidoreductase [Vicinamibacterales bacterium]|nr:DsbA family oxidoreductase [Vicinamibacterales bacterium]
MPRVALEVFSDYVCPFCRLAEPALRELLDEATDVDVTWRSFELRPNIVPPLDPHAEYLQRVWDASVYPLAETLGVTMKLPPVQPRTRRAHEAAHWARSIGRFDEYHGALLAAFFERGENIGEIDVLVALADSLGMPGGELRRALTAREFEQHVIDDEELAKQTDVGSVPAFVANGRYGVIGVQPVEVLRQLVDRARGDAAQP